MLNIKQFVFNPFDENTYLLIDEDTNQAAVIDPGMINDRERAEFDKFIADNKITLTMVINTHMHLDHSFSDNYVSKKYGVKIAAHPDDAPLGETLANQAMRFGMRLNDSDPVKIDVQLNDGDEIAIGNSKLTVLHVPGHSLGGISLYLKEQDIVFAGDSLFNGCIGRTDFIGGNHQQLIDSIHAKLLTLPANTVVLSGHGPHTTIANERTNNPYL